MAATTLRPLAGSGCKRLRLKAELATQGMAGLGWQKRTPCSTGEAGNLQHMYPKRHIGWLSVACQLGKFTTLVVRIATSWQVAPGVLMS